MYIPSCFLCCKKMTLVDVSNDIKLIIYNSCGHYEILPNVIWAHVTSAYQKITRSLKHYT